MGLGFMSGLGLGFRSELVSELVSGEKLDRSILGCGNYPI